MEDGADSKVEKVKENEKGKEVLVVVLDTPDRTKNNQIRTSTNKIEDSPVFNFLNSLSPIEPAKSIHVTQMINPLSFASIPSIFTSPHVSSLKGSRFLRRHQNIDPSKPEFSSEDMNLLDTNETTLDAANKSDKLHINPCPEVSIDEAICQPSHECSNVEVELRQHSAEYAYTSSTFAPFIQETSQTDEGVNEIDQDKEVMGCDWESFISNAPDLLICESPNETMSCKKSVEPGEGFIANISNNKSVGEGSTSELKEIDENVDIVASCSTSNPTENIDNERDSGMHRGVRRRCLVFEMGGAFRKHLDENSASDSSLLMQSNDNASPSDCQLLPAKDRGDSSRRVLAGIGLHLNSLATPNGYKFVAKFRTPAPQEEPLNNSSGALLLERETGTVENCIPPVEDDSQASGYIGNEEATRSSPKKKRTKLEQAGEGEACKRCNCKKSKCLKLYCECFAAGVYCVEPCSCLDCFNKPVHEDTVLATRKQIESRNPLAFAPKVIRSSDSLSETRGDSSKTPASARHKRGCNCKKSGCLKKYCECFQGGVGCSVNCRCEGCKNVFGRKYGSRVIGTEVELEEEKGGMAEQNDVEQNPDAALPATPSHCGRSSVQHPFSSKNKPPRSCFPSAGSSFGRTGIFVARSKIDKHFETVQEDEIPKFSEGGSPNGRVKSSSPNSKRVVSPHQTSPVMRSSRKLILQSIPSFPSLTPKH